MAEETQSQELKETEQAEAQVATPEKETIDVDKIIEIYKAETIQHAKVTRSYYKTLYYELKKRTDLSGKHPIPGFEAAALSHFENVVKHHDEDKFKDPEALRYLALRHFNHATNGEFQITEKEREMGEYYMMLHRRNNDHHVECGMYHLARCTMFGEDHKPYRYNYYSLMEMAADWCSVAEELGVDPIKWFYTQIKRGRYIVPDEVEKLLVDFMQTLSPFLEENRKLGRFGLTQPDHCIK